MKITATNKYCDIDIHSLHLTKELVDGHHSEMNGPAALKTNEYKNKPLLGIDHAMVVEMALSPAARFEFA